MTGTFVTHGAGIILPSSRARSRAESSTGLLFPTRSGSYPIAEPGIANTQTVLRGVPSEDMQIIELAFHVVNPAGSDDTCDVGILDAVFGTVLVSSGATAGKLNVAGDQVITFPNPYTLKAGTPYYAAFTYGAVGTSPATLLCANFPGGPAMAAFGGTGFGHADQLEWASASGLVVTLSSPTHTGVGVQLLARYW